MTGPSFELMSRSWLLRVAHMEGHSAAESEWDALAMPTMSALRGEIIDYEVFWLIDESSGGAGLQLALLDRPDHCYPAGAHGASSLDSNTRLTTLVRIRSS